MSDKAMIGACVPPAIERDGCKLFVLLTRKTGLNKVAGNIKEQISMISIIAI
jgi:hypothetical protein